MSTFFAKVYAPPDCGKAADISPKLSAVSTATNPFSTNARMALGPAASNATPARTRIPPPTIEPTPIPVAPRSETVRLASSSLAASLTSGDAMGSDFTASMESRRHARPALRVGGSPVARSACVAGWIWTESLRERCGQ
ncbi:MAG: hypothetical protein M5U28_19595 [Sandaracinaceae bacterium]|nr:hypothetical protein [Sandaracinaceae bacterium]